MRISHSPEAIRGWDADHQRIQRRCRISVTFCRLAPMITVEALSEERVVHAFCAPIAIAASAPVARMCDLPAAAKRGSARVAWADQGASHRLTHHSCSPSV
eukprot:scaffold119148_cov32-Tisochrysis_lutea.AAC.1